MQFHISPSFRNVTLFPGEGVRDKKIPYRIILYSLLFFMLIVRFMFLVYTVHSIDPETRCSSLGCLGKTIIGSRLMGTRMDQSVPQVMYNVLEQSISKNEQLIGRKDIPHNLEEFMSQVKESRYDARTFALKLREMVTLMEETARRAKIQDYLYRQLASSSIPKQLHCLAMRLANEYSTNAAARLHLPSPELVPALVDNSYYHIVLASDNVIAASVVAASIVDKSLRPHKFVIHIITDRKTYYPMQAWFSLHPLSPSVVEVKALHHFDWFSKGKFAVLEAMEKDDKLKSHSSEKPRGQGLTPNYNSMMNHIRIHLPELFPSLNKVVFLDDDIVVQTDLSPLWDIDLNGKVNGAVETCRGEDKSVMSKKLKSYLNFSHPLIAQQFHPEECAWAYGMNIFDLKAWRNTNISDIYNHWLQQNLKSDLSLWQLGTLAPRLIAFHGHVHAIDPFWHMLGLGYQENISYKEAESAGVIHFNGRAKPWLPIAFPHLRPLWAKHVDFSDKFIKSCHIRAA
ncbi:Probable galacturonosyltransferase 12 [Linum perenne]